MEEETKFESFEKEVKGIFHGIDPAFVTVEDNAKRTVDTFYKINSDSPVLKVDAVASYLNSRPFAPLRQKISGVAIDFRDAQQLQSLLLEEKEKHEIALLESIAIVRKFLKALFQIDNCLKRYVAPETFAEYCEKRGITTIDNFEKYCEEACGIKNDLP